MILLLYTSSPNSKNSFSKNFDFVISRPAIRRGRAFLYADRRSVVDVQNKNKRYNHRTPMIVGQMHKITPEIFAEFSVIYVIEFIFFFLVILLQFSYYVFGKLHYTNARPNSVTTPPPPLRLQTFERL